MLRLWCWRGEDVVLARGGVIRTKEGMEEVLHLPFFPSLHIPAVWLLDNVAVDCASCTSKQQEREHIIMFSYLLLLLIHPHHYTHHRLTALRRGERAI